MSTPEELRHRALSLYEQGGEHVAEANRIVHDLVFASTNEERLFGCSSCW